MADFYNITTWNEKPWYQTGGTRSKVIVENPENDAEYYFKTSLKREKKDYKYEYWSEIITSEIGTILGFDPGSLRYVQYCSTPLVLICNQHLLTSDLSSILI